VAQFDLSLDELHTYRPRLRVPADLDEFWARTLAEARAVDLEPTFTKVENGLAVLDTYDVGFRGYGGSLVRGWLHLPAAALRAGPLPAIVEFIGYNGGRGLPHERTLWAAAGYAHFVMDNRGQGSGWSVGDTADRVLELGEPATPGFLTRGIRDPHTYYYRRLFTDAVRAVEAARAHEAVDAGRVIALGGSQGGALALAVAALSDDLTAVLPDVPFLCDFRRATTIVDTDPYAEVARYLKTHRTEVDRVFDTLAYFDCAILAGRAGAPALFSVALMDDICPPSTVFAAYHNYGGEKDIVVYPFNRHEGGEAQHDLERMRWVAATLAGR
jgi:cephalosporin-C deacetylase